MADVIEDPTTYSHPSGTSEQTMLEIGIPEGATRWISSLNWFCTNLTQTTTFRIYLWNTDESSYELIDGTSGIGGTLTWNPGTSTGKCLRFIMSSILTTGSRFKITAQSSVAEGSAKNIRVSYGFLA